jgi:hypothetical protein
LLRWRTSVGAGFHDCFMGASSHCWRRNGDTKTTGYTGTRPKVLTLQSTIKVLPAVNTCKVMSQSDFWHCSGRVRL